MISHRFFDTDTALHHELATLINEQKLIPVIGSGFTRRCKAKNGVVPSGEDMTQYMKEILSIKYGKSIESFASSSFSQLCTGFDKQTTASEKFEYFSNNFTRVQLPENEASFLLLSWPYMYTLNVDDGIESNTDLEVILPKKEFFEQYIEEFNILFKIHGDVHHYLKYLGNPSSDEEIIFNKKQYIDSLKSNKKMLAKFEEDFSTNNIIYLGCSLDDEPDLLSVISASMKNNATHKNTYYVSSKQLDQQMQDSLEDYGINICIVVNDYDSFYTKIVECASARPQTKIGFVDFYREPEISEFDKTASNLSFMLLSDNLIPSPYKRKIHLPHFFIERSIIAKNILEDLKLRSPIHIVYGHRISGKTYCLFGIYNKIKDKERYFFPSNTQITDSILEELVNKKNTALFFDTQVLSSSQLTKVLDCKEKFLQNRTYVIACINTSDRYAVNLIVNNMNYKATPLSNVFSREESIALNAILESSNMPRFGFFENIFDGVKNRYVKKYYTLLDNLFKIASSFGKTNQHYVFPKISDISTKEDLAIIILLATQQAISSYDMYYFDISRECSDFSRKFPTLAEWIYIDAGLTRKGSNQRLNANTRYYLLKILGDYSADTNKHSAIIDAYQYIYEKISDAEPDPFYRTRKMLDFVKFDVINDIFYQKNNSVVELIKNIYEALEEEMNTNPQFKHQRAKSILWLSQDDFEEINTAINYIDLAYHNTETISRTKNNRFLNISLGHISYTRALLYGRICSIEKYSDIEHINKAIHYYREALFNPINKEELDALHAQKTDRRIKKDLQKLVSHVLSTSGLDSDLVLSAEELQSDLKFS